MITAEKARADTQKAALAKVDLDEIFAIITGAVHEGRFHVVLSLASVARAVVEHCAVAIGTTLAVLGFQATYSAHVFGYPALEVSWHPNSVPGFTG